MSDDEKALLAKILAEPQNDLARLVYADWLEGDADPPRPEQAHFIRAQIAGEDCVVPVAMVEDTTTVIGFARNQRWWEWAPNNCEITFGSWTLSYKRGLLTEVKAPYADLLERGQALLATHPIERVRLAGYAPSCWGAGWGAGPDGRQTREWVWERSMADQPDPEQFTYFGAGPYSQTQADDASILPANLFDEMTGEPGGTYFMLGKYGHRRYDTEAAAYADVSDTLLARARRQNNA